MPTKTVQQFLYAQIETAILNIDAAIAADVYALSLMIYVDAVVPKEVKVTIGYNTLSYFEEAKAKTKTTNENEAKWKMLFWQPEDLTVIDGSDPNIEAWIRSLGCDFTHQDVLTDFDKYYDLSREFAAKYVEIIISICRQLHTDGVIEKKFGRDLPIIICQSVFCGDPALSSAGEILEWTLHGNPDGQAAEFEQWMKQPPKTETATELHERLIKATTINWEEKSCDGMTHFEFYKNFIDSLVFGYLSISVPITQLVEREEFSPEDTKNDQWLQFLSGLTREQRDLIASNLLKERRATIHDLLAQLTYWIDCAGMQIMRNGEPVPTGLNGGMHYDYIGRLDDEDRWEWPDKYPE